MSKVLYEKRDRIAYVTLNRPEAKNAIDWETHHLLWRTWEDFAGDDAIDVAILTGAGDAFCSGADLKTFIPEWINNAGALRVRENVKTGLGGADTRLASHLQARHRSGQRVGVGGRPGDSARV